MHSVAKRPYVMLDTVQEVAQPEDFAPETTSRRSMSAGGLTEACPSGLRYELSLGIVESIARKSRMERNGSGQET